MAEVMFSGPVNSLSPAVLRGLRNNLIKDFEWKVRLGFESGDSLGMRIKSSYFKNKTCVPQFS